MYVFAFKNMPYLEVLRMNLSDWCNDTENDSTLCTCRFELELNKN